MSIKRIAPSLLLIAALAGIAHDGFAQRTDATVMLQFQRAADSYAFAHRQDERRGVSAPPRAEGELFTPLAGAAFRARIRSVAGGCNAAGRGEGSFVVPAVNASAAGTEALPGCLVAVLPHLPAELEYRAAGMALMLIDAHRNIVVDVLHAAFP